MPIIYTIDRSARVVYLTSVGDLSFNEWRDAMLGVLSDGAFERGFNFINDRREATPVEPDFLDRQAAFFLEHEGDFGRCRWASVVPDPATDTAKRMAMSRAGLKDIEFEFFYDPASARRWVFGGV